MTDNTQALRLSRGVVLTFAITVFVSAFLLFQIQPLISRVILPWFGGSPAVWTTCMLFFQAVLFAGYAWAHILNRFLRLRSQLLLHAALLVVSAVLLKILPDADLKPEPDTAPIAGILSLLLVSVGLPYFLLSSTGPLLQAWFAQAGRGRSPWRLYAVSNAGSLLALLSFPFVFEPLMDVSTMGKFWSGGFILFACVCITSGILAVRHAPAVEAENEARQAKLPFRSMATWFALACLPSVALLAITNTACMDVAVIPFLWIVPLALYLLSFILCFDSQRWYHRALFAVFTLLLSSCLCGLLMFGSVFSLPLPGLLALYFSLLFCICMMCHGELARLKPDSEHLTVFYLTMSAGGACGGLFAGLIAPTVFSEYWELHLCLGAAIICALWVTAHSQNWLGRRLTAPMWAMVVAAIPVVLFITFTAEAIMSSQDTIAVSRSFYGVLRIEKDSETRALLMRHGRVVHGVQLPNSWQQPTTYYSRGSGVGRTIAAIQSEKPGIKAGLVGLGCGTLAAYGRPEDKFRFYEINFDVIEQAQTHFDFLKNSPSQNEISLGDARLVLESEEPQHFDLLVLDAFSGDAVPTHLLTKEAFQLYQTHLNDDGVIAIHISNRYFDLRPVIDAAAEKLKLQTLTLVVPEQQELIFPSSEWVILSRSNRVMLNPAVRQIAIAHQQKRVLWTDSYSNLFGILK